MHIVVADIDADGAAAVADELNASTTTSAVLCPSATRTAIAESDRLRPAHLRTEQSFTSVAVSAGLGAMLEHGIEPSETAEAIRQALSTGDFLIPTKPSYAAQLSMRNDALVARQLPGNPTVD